MGQSGGEISETGEKDPEKKETRRRETKREFDKRKHADMKSKQNRMTGRHESRVK